MCNIHTVVGIPVRSKIGLVVIGLYSLYDLKEDPKLVDALISECQKFDPEPKWSLFMDIPSSVNPVEPNGTARVSLHQQCRDSNTSICAESVTSSLGSTMSSGKRNEHLSLSEANCLANLLASHMPVAGNINPSTPSVCSPLSSFISLRLLLLRYPSGCTEHQNKSLCILKMSFIKVSAIQVSFTKISTL